MGLLDDLLYFDWLDDEDDLEVYEPPFHFKLGQLRKLCAHNLQKNITPQVRQFKEVAPVTGALIASYPS